jgi:non-histone protein 10
LSTVDRPRLTVNFNKKSKKESPQKDPNVPKKPTNAYIIFASEKRQNIKEESGLTDNKELIKEIARRWKEERDSNSQVYKDYTKKLEEAKKNYEKEITKNNDNLESKENSEKEINDLKATENSEKEIAKNNDNIQVSLDIDFDENNIPEPPSNYKKSSKNKQ